MKEKGECLKLTGAGQYKALPCVSNTANTTSEVLATGGGDEWYYLNESRAMKEFAARAGFTLMKLPAKKWSRHPSTCSVHDHSQKPARLHGLRGLHPNRGQRAEQAHHGGAVRAAKPACGIGTARSVDRGHGA
jgi:hypothetical protein